jgi:hypothetical protein
MGILMVTVWVPTNMAIEMAKMYLKQPREIPYVTKWRAFNTTGGIHGHKQYHLIYTERGKLEEAGLEISKYFLPFTTKLEGFRYDIENLAGVSDTYKLIGMEW